MNRILVLMNSSFHNPMHTYPKCIICEVDFVDLYSYIPNGIYLTVLKILQKVGSARLSPSENMNHNMLELYPLTSSEIPVRAL